MNDIGRLGFAGGRITAEDGQDRVYLRVSDSGRGIRPEALEQIFDLFYTTRNSEGFGIGLFIARNIAEQHGGSLRAESGAEGGAVMILTLPARKETLPG